MSPAAPRIRSDDTSVGLDSPAPKNRPIGLQPLPEHFEPEIIKTSERGQVRAGEGSVRHVEVFQMGKSPPSSGDLDPYPATDAPTGLHPQLRLRRAQIAPGARVGPRATFGR